AEFEHPLHNELHALYLDQAIETDGSRGYAGHLDPIRDAAKTHDVVVVIGIAERPRDRAAHTIYASAVTIGTTGDVLSVHRKLMPTHEERLAWAPGDANGLQVHRLPRLAPFALGSLNCWENWIPLARAAMHAQGEDLHVAIWPGRDFNTKDITRFAAREGRSFVLSASARLSLADIPSGFPGREHLLRPDRGGEHELIHNGGSAIAGPDGEWITPPDTTTDGLVVGEVDHRRVLEERQNFDHSGHYGRPDLLRLSVNRRRMTSADFTDE
ncbi:MAG: nitrilase-related carbon-nitrogen hydrolase, partial [Planctomycetota bacterium]